MLTYIETGSIFDSGCDVLICPVNCIGVMGAGLAKEFREKFPVASGYYKKVCIHGSLQPGHCLAEYREKTIIFAATKDHWRDPSRLEWVDSCLERIAAFFAPAEGQVSSKSIALPALGCGLGQLAWADVKASIDRIFGPLEGLTTKAYTPQETPNG